MASSASVSASGGSTPSRELSDRSPRSRSPWAPRDSALSPLVVAAPSAVASSVDSAASSIDASRGVGSIWPVSFTGRDSSMAARMLLRATTTESATAVTAAARRPDKVSTPAARARTGSPVAASSCAMASGVSKTADRTWLKAGKMIAATTLMASTTTTCSTPRGTAVGVGLGTMGRLSAVYVSWRAVWMASRTPGSPSAAAGKTLSRPTTPTSNAFNALGATNVPSATMAACAAAFVGPVTDAAVTPSAVHRSPDCRAVRRVPGVWNVVTNAVAAVSTISGQMIEQ
ncbi:hypothetical protein [Mycolicibacterium pyrenivorans]|uniref:hypothetical protein n=1 Tax=Mycolicibacterium pyrenivorans TaxID=187102 RepID=UPI0021F319FF|nr:hypothetical protein [Mycolicibacterium pyrenivorans]MCV7151905.1 hypothetical protein [Mycolicibacterium pyrenivorans]